MHLSGKKLYMPSGNVFKKRRILPKLNNRLQFACSAFEDVRPKYVTHALPPVSAVKKSKHSRG
jgi:hypothetical protein